MKHLSVRLKLYFLVCCSAAALVMVAACGWWSIQALSEALDIIGDRRLPAVTALTAMHTARLESAKAMQDALAFRPDQYNDVPVKDDLITEVRWLFGETLALAEQANTEGESAFAAYDALPRSDEEQELWAQVSPVWQDYLSIDARQMELTKALTRVTDWEFLISDYSVFASNTVQWSAVVDQLTPLLKELSTLNIDSAQAAQQAGEVMVTRTRALMLVIISVALLIVCALGILVIRSIITSLLAIRTAIARVSDSNDFTLRAELGGRDELAQTATAFNLLLENVQGSLQAVVTSTETVNNAADQVLSVSREVSESASKQRESASAMSVVAEQLVASIGRIAGNTHEASARSLDASTAAEEGAENVAQTADAMELIAQEITQAGQAVGDLGRESARISKVVEVIKEVAEQTNLLALNAAIEAARAGAQGRGFAVVADEVRKLAERTTSSVQDISQTVAAMQNSTDSTVNSVEAVVVRAQRGRALSEQAAVRIGQIRDSVRQATVSVADVSTALSEQEQATKDISQHVEAIAHASDASCVIGERTANVSRDLENAANALRESVGRFKV